MLKSHCTLQARYVNIVQNDFTLKQRSKVTLLFKFFFRYLLYSFPTHAHNNDDMYKLHTYM